MNLFGEPFSYNLSFEEFADAQVFIEHTLNIITIVFGIIALGIAGGIYYRIKTIKH